MQVYLLIERRERHIPSWHANRKEDVVLSSHSDEDAAWEEAARLDSTGNREFSVAVYDPEEDDAAA